MLQALRDPLKVFTDFALGPVSYIVLAVGGRYYVKNGGTGELEYSDVDAVKAIQYAINKVIDIGGGTVVLKGEFYFPPFTGPTQYGDALIAVPASNVRLRIVGDEAVLHLPQNNTPDRQVWLFTVANQNLDVGVVRVSFENLHVIDDVNTGAKPSNFLVSSGKGVEVEVRNCVFRFNRLGGFGIWLNNGLGARIEGGRFLEVGGRTAILFDSVDLGKVSDSLFINRKYGRIGSAIGLGTGNVIVTNSEFYGLGTVFSFGNVDGETTLSASNNIFGAERHYHFTMPDGSLWIMLPVRLIYIHDVSNLRINIENSYIAAEIFIAGDSPTGRVVDVYVGNSIVRGSVAPRVYQNTNGYPIVNLYFNNCQFGLADFSRSPINFLSGGFESGTSKPYAPANYYIRNSRLYVRLVGADCIICNNNHFSYGSMSLEAVLENNLIYVKNIDTTTYSFYLFFAGTEDPEYVTLTARFRNNKLILDGLIGLVFAGGHPRYPAYSTVDLLMYNNEIIYKNGASFSSETLFLGNYIRTMIRRNIGYATENGGVATIPAGSTRVTVSHGLATAPSKVLITPLAQPPSRLWVENITATSFDIVADVAPTADLSIAWYAEV
jgi:hypothetical protein